VTTLPLALRIENVDTLPDGGPISTEIDRRGIDIGRDAFMDWTLPDTERFISGKHCEIHFRDGGYWLHDVSTNGTTINGRGGRITEPYNLQDGDKIYIGSYIVAVSLSGPEIGAPASAEQPAAGGAGGDMWAVQGAAEAVDAREFRQKSGPAGGAPRPAGPDLADEHIRWGVGNVENSPPPDPAGANWASVGSGPAPAGGDAPDWATGGGTPSPAPATPTPAPAPPATPVPTPAAQPRAAPDDDAPAADWRTPPPESIEPGAAASPPDAVGPPVAAPPPREEPAPLVLTSQMIKPEQAPDSGIAGQWSQDSAPPSTPAVAPTPDPAPDPAPEPAAEEPAPPGAGGAGLVAAFERGAGLPAGSVAGYTDESLAEELGRLFRITAQNLQAMLLARAETKSAMRSSERTMIGALENNPLKFSPTPEDAMRIMFGKKTQSYLDAGKTLEESFGDLQKHQILTFSAMQQALQALIEDLDPDNIAGDTSQDGGLAGLISSRRAKLWDTYVERFKSKSARHERGMIDAFMILYSEMYDRQS